MLMKKAAICAILALVMLALAVAGVALAAPPPQAATATLPANRAEINQDVNVRSGPGTEYDQVGVLIPGQTSAIIGRNAEGTWFEISYVGAPDGTGWVFKDLVHIVGDINSMPTVVPPPTPTLNPTTTPEFGVTEISGTVTGTVTGTVALVATAVPTHLPTFTPPAPAPLPTLLPAQGIHEGGSFPPAVLIIILLVLGTSGSVLSLLRLRR